MDLVVNHVWSELIDNWGKSPRYIAVAYFSCDSDLPFDAADVLIINASDGAIKSGQTDAKAVRRAFERGVNVFSHSQLHAKVYVLGGQVFVGSANSSISSRKNLVECLASSDNPHSVSEGIGFVLALQRQASEVDEVFLSRIEAIPVEREFATSERCADSVKVSRQRCWLLGTHDAVYPGDEDSVEEENQEVRNELAKQDETVSWIWWPLNGSKFIRDARGGDLLINISLSEWQNPDIRKARVYRHARICRITQEPSVRAKVFHVAWPGDCEETALRWKHFCKIARNAGWNADLKLRSCREVPWKQSKKIYDLWSG